MRIEVRDRGVKSTEALRNYVGLRLMSVLDHLVREVDGVTVCLADVHAPEDGINKRCRMRALLLVVVEATDVVFAVDSIPAIFAITTDPFIVYTSNIFAILGLRARAAGLLPVGGLADAGERSWSMGEVLFWTMAVFAVLGGPPLLAIWSQVRRERRERKEAEQREQRRSEHDGEHTRRSERAGRPASSSGGWTGMFLVAWTL